MKTHNATVLNEMQLKMTQFRYGKAFYAFRPASHFRTGNVFRCSNLVDVKLLFLIIFMLFAPGRAAKI